MRIDLRIDLMMINRMIINRLFTTVLTFVSVIATCPEAPCVAASFFPEYVCLCVCMCVCVCAHARVCPRTHTHTHTRTHTRTHTHTYAQTDRHAKHAHTHTHTHTIPKAVEPVPVREGTSSFGVTSSCDLPSETFAVVFFLR